MPNREHVAVQYVVLTSCSVPTRHWVQTWGVARRSAVLTIVVVSTGHLAVCVCTHLKVGGTLLVQDRDVGNAGSSRFRSTRSLLE